MHGRRGRRLQAVAALGCDVVEGTALRITGDDLAAADDYERALIPLASGLYGWVYAASRNSPDARR
ncbi:hypothetical protein GCM10009850_083360 [Nonomuraea monospora]|uniref:Uncharacterized protein n=1 Tax=Nonomuraea monospora TaxID=568818 RepID=A0ABN3CTW1_9ACTN